MYGDANAGRNWDGRRLSGDHSIARSHGGKVADRLMHWQCNTDRGDGSHDHQRPALHRGTPAVATDLGTLQMAWP